MSEYWVSHKRYICKYCNIYIADDKPSRQQHENGLRHKGNVERFVKGLYKDGEKRVREREEEKGIMASIGKAAEAAYALDVASGRTGAGSSTSRAITRQARDGATVSKARVGKPTDPYANYSTPASLGYTDPELEERQDAGVPGAWTVVRKEEDVTRGEKRREREQVEVEVDEEDTRAFKVQKKMTTVGLGEMYDPGKEANQVEPVTEPSLFRKRKARVRGD